MIKINKKGTDEKSLGLISSLVIAGIIFLMFLAVFVILGETGSSATQEAACRTSVILRGKATITLVKGLVEFEKITPLACNTEDLGKLKGTREEVKKEIANKAAKCWWQFADGSVPDLFKAPKIQSACFVCYTFTVKDNLDKGTPSMINVFAEPASRDSKNISSFEMTNFLVSDVYNPGIIYGGGTKNYFGTKYVYGINVPFAGEPRKISPSSIKSMLVSGYVLDFSYMINENTKTEINKLGTDLQQKGIGTLFVVVADEFKSMENSDARTIIENTNLNSNDTNYDAILIMLDLKQKTMRIHAGSDLSVLIKEYDFDTFMKKEFKAAADECKSNSDPKCATDSVNHALLRVTTDIHDKLTSQNTQLLGISPKSYYYYLTNGGYTWTMISDIVPDKTYAITYVAASDETGWKVLTPALTIVGAVGGVIGGLALTVSGVGAPGGIPLLITSVGVLGGAGAAAGYGGGRLINAPEQNVRPNNIMIVPVNNLGDKCTMVKN